MRNLKKLLALTLVVVMVFALGASALAKPLAEYGDTDDVADVAKSYPNVDYAYSLELISDLEIMFNNENTDHTKTLTRAEFFEALSSFTNGRRFTDTERKLWSANTVFTDLIDWQKPAANWAFEKGLTKGVGNDKFAPNDKLDYYTALVGIMRALGYVDEMHNWLWDNTTASKLKVLSMASDFNLIRDFAPLSENAITRGELAVLFANALDATRVTYTDKGVMIPVTDSFGNPSVYLTFKYNMVNGEMLVTQNGLINANAGKTAFLKDMVETNNITLSASATSKFITNDLVGHVVRIRYAPAASGNVSTVYSVIRLSDEDVTYNGTGTTAVEDAVTALNNRDWNNDNNWEAAADITYYENYVTKDTVFSEAIVAGDKIRGVVYNDEYINIFVENYTLVLIDKDLNGEGKFANTITYLNGQKPGDIVGYAPQKGDYVLGYNIAAAFAAHKLEATEGTLNKISADDRTVTINTTGYKANGLTNATTATELGLFNSDNFGAHIGKAVIFYPWQGAIVVGLPKDGTTPTVPSNLAVVLADSYTIGSSATNPFETDKDTVMKVQVLLDTGATEVYTLAGIKHGTASLDYSSNLTGKNGFGGSDSNDIKIRIAGNDVYNTELKITDQMFHYSIDGDKITLWVDAGLAKVDEEVFDGTSANDKWLGDGTKAILASTTMFIKYVDGRWMVIKGQTVPAYDESTLSGSWVLSSLTGGAGDQAVKYAILSGFTVTNIYDQHTYGFLNNKYVAPGANSSKFAAYYEVTRTDGEKVVFKSPDLDTLTAAQAYANNGDVNTVYRFNHSAGNVLNGTVATAFPSSVTITTALTANAVNIAEITDLIPGFYLKVGANEVDINTGVRFWNLKDGTYIPVDDADVNKMVTAAGKTCTVQVTTDWKNDVTDIFLKIVDAT